MPLTNDEHVKLKPWPRRDSRCGERSNHLGGAIYLGAACAMCMMRVKTWLSIELQSLPGKVPLSVTYTETARQTKLPPTPRTKLKFSGQRVCLQ